MKLFWKEELDGYKSDDYVSSLKFYESDMFEFSTQHFDSDSHRIIKGD